MGEPQVDARINRNYNSGAEGCPQLTVYKKGSLCVCSFQPSPETDQNKNSNLKYTYE